MAEKISQLLDKISDYLAHRKGLLLLVGLLLVVINLILQIFPIGWISDSNLFLHVGIILTILGTLLAWAL